MKELNENQKKFLGTVPKKYQLVETFWDCPEISKTSNKGITLIALIITIIVMLILVGVTINVALNGGLFGKANEAAKQMEEKTIYEQIVGAMQLTNAGKIDVKGTYEAAKADLELQGKTVILTSPATEAEITDTTTSVIFNVKGKNEEYTYTITAKEIIIGESAENKFYGYAYVKSSGDGAGDAYVRFLNNGIGIASTITNDFECDGGFFLYERNENILNLCGGELELELKDDCSDINNFYIRDLSNYFMNDPKIDEEINIYKDAFYSNSTDSEIIYINNDKEVIIGSGTLEGTFEKVNISEIEITTQTTFNYNSKTFTIIDNV